MVEQINELVTSSSAVSDELMQSLSAGLLAVQVEVKKNRPTARTSAMSESEMFLSSAAVSIETCISLAPKTPKDISAGSEIFRSLHTLKGNAQMNKMKAIADLIHTAENSIEEINNLLFRSVLCKTTEHNCSAELFVE